MLNIIDLPFLLVLGYLAYNDFKHHHIPDIVVGILWLLSTPYLTLALPVSFALLVVANAIAFAKTKLPLIGWGDVMALPPVVSFVYYFKSTNGVLIFLCMLAVGVIAMTQIEKTDKPALMPPVLIAGLIVYLV